MKFTLTIKLGNAAMQTPDDVAGALARLLNGPHLLLDAFSVGDGSALRDENGNTVGEWSVSE